MYFQGIADAQIARLTVAAANASGSEHRDARIIGFVPPRRLVASLVQVGL
jgi:hypothetical protein